MQPKQNDEGRPSNKWPNFDRIRINVDDATLSRLQRAEVVKMTVFCHALKNNISFMLKNRGTIKGKPSFIEDVEVPVDEKTFIGMMNPALSVTFCSGNVLAPFSTISMVKEGFFTGNEPIAEQLMN